MAAVVLLLIGSPSAVARPPHKQALRKHFGRFLSATLDQCWTCHQTQDEAGTEADYDPESPPHNAFGARLAELGADHPAAPAGLIARLNQIADEDSDGDGLANLLEIVSGRRPGSADPPATADTRLAAEETLRQFTRELGDYAWEPFQPVVRPELPTGSRGPPSHPIDAWLAAAQARQQLVPLGEAPPAVLLRRVYLDLIGLPPTRDELAEFLSDPAPGAYERVVDRLLADPRHGERWARHWMDIWRYSDWAGWTDGKQIRDSQPHIWRWRDWIVESLNADRPYDDMLRQMLAADELAPDDPDALRATGFLVRNYKMLSRETWLQEAVEHTAKAFLGLTLNCARCHDHRYDPIAQEEYYQFRAIFEPYQVRLERLPGQADTTVDALARVFDGSPDEPTYVFERGDDRQPRKDRPIAPGVPSMLSWAPLAPQSVPLPVTSAYPDLRPFVESEMLASAAQQVGEAQAADQAAQAALVAAQQALAQAQSLAASGGDAAGTSSVDAAAAAATGAQRQQQLAAARLAAAQRQQQALAARITAENGKYADPPPADQQDLAATAARLTREAQATAAAAELLAAELALDAARAPADGQEANPQAIADAEKQRDERKKQLEAAQTALADTSSDYPPLGPVYPRSSTGRRTALARWLTDRRNPLVARVAVNHLWRRHFGQALVTTTFDFGQNGARPTQPALLDWLAAELMEPPSGVEPWSLRHLHRLIVTSAAYRRASNFEPALAALDSENRAHWRFLPRRMEAEVVRDSVLYVAGQLDLTQGGVDLDYALGQTVFRRSLYFRHAAEKQMPFLKLFDAAAVTECYERKESIVPQQALALANSELVVGAARHLASRLQASDDAQFIAAAFAQVLARPAAPAEVEACLRFLDARAAAYAAAPPAPPTEPAAGPAAPPSTDPVCRARENLVHVLFNHHDFVTIH